MIVLSLIVGIVALVYTFVVASSSLLEGAVTDYVLVVCLAALAATNLHNYITYFIN